MSYDSVAGILTFDLLRLKFLRETFVNMENVNTKEGVIENDNRCILASTLR